MLSVTECAAGQWHHSLTETESLPNPEQHDLHVYDLMRQVGMDGFENSSCEDAAHARRDWKGSREQHHDSPRSDNNGTHQMDTAGIPTGRAHLQVQPALQVDAFSVHTGELETKTQPRQRSCSSAGNPRSARLLHTLGDGLTWDGA